MLACARVRVDQEQVTRIQQAAAGIVDWDAFIQTCIRHKVLPLVFQNLTSICPDSFPEHLKSKLDNGYIFENSLHNHALVEELFVILNVLQKHNITAVPFKGPVLAQNAFGDFTLRRYLDLDVFISTADAGKAVDVLLRQGFVTENGTFGTDGINDSYLQRIPAITLVHPDKHLSLDLQWDISNRFANIPIVLDDMADRIEKIMLNDKEVPSLPVEELFCYLCLHGTKHRWFNLDMVCCVAELIRVRKDIDWPYVMQYAKKLHCVKVVLLGSVLASNLLGAKLPESINIKIAQTKTMEHLAEQVYEGLFSTYMDSMKTPEKFDSLLFQVKDRISDKIYYCVKMVFIPTKKDLEVLPLPNSLSFIRYIIRPIRLIIEYCKRRIVTVIRFYKKKSLS